MTTNLKSYVVAMCTFASLAALTIITSLQPIQVKALSLATTDNFYFTQRTIVPGQSPQNKLGTGWVKYNAYHQNFVNSTLIRGVTDYDDGLSVGILKQIESNPSLAGLYYTRENVNANSNRSYDLYMELYNGHTYADSVTPNPQSAQDIEAFKMKEKRFDPSKEKEFADIDIYAYQFNYPVLFPESNKQQYSNAYRFLVNYDKPVFDGVEFTYTYYNVYNKKTKTFSGWTSPDKTWLAYPIDKTISHKEVSNTVKDNGISLELRYDPINRSAQVNGSIESDVCFEQSSYKDVEPVISQSGKLERLDLIIESTPTLQLSTDCNNQKVVQNVQWRFSQIDLTKYQEIGFENATGLDDFFANNKNFGIKRTGNITPPTPPNFETLGELDLRTAVISGGCTTGIDANGNETRSCSSSYTPQGMEFAIVPLVNSQNNTLSYPSDKLPKPIFTGSTDEYGTGTYQLLAGDYSVFLKLQNRDEYYCFEVIENKACSIEIKPSNVTLAEFAFDTNKIAG